MEKSINQYLVPAIIAFSLFLLALLNDWNYDETCTYLFVKENSVFDLLTYQKFNLANHHLLNSLCFKLLQKSGLEQVIFYRLLSLLSFFVFWYANKNILKQLEISSSYILLIVIAPYYIYFTLGRGYGFSLAMCSLSLMYLLKFKENKTRHSETLFLATGVVSVLSIFSFLYIFMGMLMIYVYINRSLILSLNSSIKLILVSIFLMYVYYAGKIINVSDSNIIGSNSFFTHGTISSFFSEFSYHNYQSILNSELYYPIVKKIIFLCLLSPLLVFFKINKMEVVKQIQPFFLLMTMSLLLMLCSNFLFHAKFPMGRAIIYLQYLYLLILVILVKKTGKKLIRIPIIVLFAFSAYMNSTHFIELFKPSVKEALSQSNDYPLYVSNTNPNIRLYNNFKNYKNNELIIQSKSIHQIFKWIQQESNDVIYVLCRKNELANMPFSFNFVKNFREGMLLVKIVK